MAGLAACGVSGSRLHNLATNPGRLGVAETTVRAWRRKGIGPRYMKVGRAVRYRVADVEAYEREIVRDTILRERVRYAAVIERGPTSYGAHIPDLPGCAAVGETAEQACALLREAMVVHLTRLRETGQSIPEARITVAYIGTN